MCVGIKEFTVENCAPSLYDYYHRAHVFIYNYYRTSTSDLCWYHKGDGRLIPLY